MTDFNRLSGEVVPKPGDIDVAPDGKTLEAALGGLMDIEVPDPETIMQTEGAQDHESDPASSTPLPTRQRKS